MSLATYQAEFTRMVQRLILYATDEGYALRFGDVWRSTDKLKCPSCSHEASYQELLVANGKSKVAFGKHQDRLAVDFIISRTDGEDMHDADYRKLGEYWECLGGRWGGRFGLLLEDYASKIGWDAGHFEKASQ